MKKSLLALAVLGAFAGAAAAQSSVTIGGFVDQGVGKTIGSKNKTLLDSGGSRLYFKGQEDLGGGTAAIFNIEHRFNPADGTAAATFWNGRSTVGLTGAFGTVELGRDYTVAFLMIQNQIDPFGGDTVAALRGTGMMVGGLAKFRTASEIQYHFSANGFNIGADVGGASENKTAKKPFSLAANYAAGPLFVGAGLEQNGDDGVNKARLWNVGARYNLGVATLSAGTGQGKFADGTKAKGFLLGAVVPLGAGDLKLGYAKENKNEVTPNGQSRFGIGYQYNLSKRTKLYVDMGHESKIATEKNGYDLGIRHNF